MKTKIYVGIESGGIRETFRSETEPTRENTPWFCAVIGPFRTLRGANFCRDYGAGNPHVQCVADAERIAATYARRALALA